MARNSKPYPFSQYLLCVTVATLRQTQCTSHYPQPVVSGWSMRRFEKLDLDIMSRGNFIANNELNSALSGSFLNSTGVHQRSSLDHRISNKIQVSLTGGEEYETWMNFANNAAVLTMSNTFVHNVRFPLSTVPRFHFTFCLFHTVLSIPNTELYNFLK